MDDTSLEPAKNPQGVYRSRLERTAFEAWVAKMVLGGHAQDKLVELYEEEFNKITTQSTISKTITKLRKDWKVSAREDTEMYINMELERLDVMEQIAWENYRTCGGTIQDTLVQDLFYYDPEGKNEKKRQSITTIKTKDVPMLAMKWFDRILKIQTDRRKVLKLEATVNINNIMAVKGYAYFNPGKDWEQQPPNLPEPNVVDAEFEDNYEQG